MAHTIRDVSKIAGVSTATVSRTFANPDSVREETRRKVMEAARLLNYSPNAIARSMARQQTEKLAFLICKKGSSILDEFYAGICDGIMKATNQSDYQLMITTEADWNTSKRNQVDGMILGGDATIGLVSECRNQDIKVVLVNNEIEGFSFPCVINDEEKGMRLAIEHLLDRGHRKIGFLAGRFSPYISEKRYHAFQKILREHGVELPPGYIRITDTNLSSSMESARQMLMMKDRPTAIIGANDEIATGIMKAAIRMGLRIPEDLAVVGYDDSRVCSAVEPELTSVHIYRHEMGRQAAELMLQILRGEFPHRQKIVVDPTLHIRASS